MGRLIIDGNRVYEMDEECLQKKAQEAGRQQKKQLGGEKGLQNRPQNGSSKRR